MDELMSRERIRDASLRYARGADRLDAALIDSVFFPDAIIEHAGMVFDGRGWGSTIVATMQQISRGSRHLMVNQHIELDGDTAYSETYCDAHILVDDGDGGMQLINRAIRYVDQFELRDGEWRVSVRKTVLDWDRIEPLAPRPPANPYVQGSRSTSDVSYLRPLAPERADPHISTTDEVLAQFSR